MPQEIYWVVVCDDNNHKKAYRINYTHFVEFVRVFTPGKPPKVEDQPTLSDTPTLFKTEQAAHEMRLRTAEYFKGTDTGKNYHFEVHPFRVFQSQATHYSEERDGRIQDAKRVASGMMFYDDIAKEVKKLAGKVLTILDAAYVNENQNKAVKDLVKTSFRSQLSDMWKDAFRDPNDLCAESEGPCLKDILD